LIPIVSGESEWKAQERRDRRNGKTVDGRWVIVEDIWRIVGSFWACKKNWV
jgi:hypothetical protein